MSTNLSKSVSILPVRSVAKKCEVEEPTVTKWIRENRIPAAKIGKKYFIREDHLEMFRRCGNHMPPDYGAIDNRSDQMDLFDPSMLPNLGDCKDSDALMSGEAGAGLYPFVPINGFSAWDAGNKPGWAMPKNPKFPNDFYPQINFILKECPQFENSYGNFMRYSVFSTITIVLQEMKRKGATIDPMWESYASSQAAIQKFGVANKVISEIQDARKKLFGHDDISWARYVKEQKKSIESMEEPWKKMAQDSLTGKLVKKEKAKPTEEDFDFESFHG